MEHKDFYTPRLLHATHRRIGIYANTMRDKRWCRDRSAGKGAGDMYYGSTGGEERQQKSTNLHPDTVSPAVLRAENHTLDLPCLDDLGSNGGQTNSDSISNTGNSIHQKQTRGAYSCHGKAGPDILEPSIFLNGTDILRRWINHGTHLFQQPLIIEALCTCGEIFIRQEGQHLQSVMSTTGNHKAGFPCVLSSGLLCATRISENSFGARFPIHRIAHHNQAGKLTDYLEVS